MSYFLGCISQTNKRKSLVIEQMNSYWKRTQIFQGTQVATVWLKFYILWGLTTAAEKWPGQTFTIMWLHFKYGESSFQCSRWAVNALATDSFPSPVLVFETQTLWPGICQVRYLAFMLSDPQWFACIHLPSVGIIRTYDYAQFSVLYSSLHACKARTLLMELSSPMMSFVKTGSFYIA